jgi:hypothetical protein
MSRPASPALTGGSVQSTLISRPFDITAKKMGYEILGEMADLGLPYQHEMLATNDKFLKSGRRPRANSCAPLLREFIYG